MLMCLQLGLYMPNAKSLQKSSANFGVVKKLAHESVLISAYSNLDTKNCCDRVYANCQVSADIYSKFGVVSAFDNPDNHECVSFLL